MIGLAIVGMLSGVQWAALIVAVVGGVLVAKYFSSGSGSEVVAPKVKVLGVHPDLPPSEWEVRSLVVAQGAVEWVHDEGDKPGKEEGVVVPLDERYKVGEGLYMANVATGHVFVPSFADAKAEGVDLVDGETFFKFRRSASVDKLMAAQDSDLLAALKYAPWAFGLAIALLIVIAIAVLKG